MIFDRDIALEEVVQSAREEGVRDISRYLNGSGVAREMVTRAVFQFTDPSSGLDFPGVTLNSRQTETLLKEVELALKSVGRPNRDEIFQERITLPQELRSV